MTPAEFRKKRDQLLQSLDPRSAFLQLACEERSFLSDYCARHFCNNFPRLCIKNQLWKIYAALTLLPACIALLKFAQIASVVTSLTILSIILFCAILTLDTFLASISRFNPATPTRAQPPTTLPSFSLLIPLFREKNAISGLLSHLNCLDYPANSLEIFLLCEESDPETLDEITSWLAKNPCRFTCVPLTVPRGTPQTKPRALNYGLAFARGDVIVVYDAEDRPELDQLRSAAALFAAAPPHVVCAQASLTYYNANQNWLTRSFALEYAFQFDLQLPGMAKFCSFLPLGGTSFFIKTSILRSLGGWDPYNVTEDLDLGLRLAFMGFSSTFLHSSTYEEATSSLSSWIPQRIRWQKGHLLCFVSYLFHLTSKPQNSRMQLRESFCFFIGIGSKVLRAIFAPFVVAFFLLWLSPWHQLSSDSPFDLALLYWVIAFCLILTIYLLFHAGKRRFSTFFCLNALSSPIYGLLVSISSCIGLFSMIFRPFYWHKTQHMQSSALRLLAQRCHLSLKSRL